jgi:hypothetical protein
MEIITINLSDGIEEVVDDMEIWVESVNDIPELNLPDGLTFLEDETIEFDVADFCNDVDGDQLSMTATSEILQLNISGMSLTISAPSDWNGNTDVSITVYDNYGASAQANILIEVEPVNDVPVIALPDNFSFAEDEGLSLDLSEWCWDVDSDILIYTVESNEIITVVNGSILTLSSPANWHGNEIVAVNINDGNRVCSSDLVEIVVVSVNDMPWIDLPAEMSFYEDESLNILLSDYSGDIEDDILQFTAESEELLVNISGSEAIVTADENWSGTGTIVFTVNDGFAGSESNDTMIVNVIPQNDAPQIILPASFSFDEDDSIDLDLSIYVTDIDDENFSYEIECSTIISELSGSSLHLSAPSNWFGSEEILITVFDDMNRLQASDVTQIIVLPINDTINVPWFTKQFIHKK